MDKKSKCLLALLMLFTSFGFSQDGGDIGLFIKDMKFLADNFARPASNGAAYQASAGWFSSAASLKEWDVRLSVHGNALFVPTSKKSFTVSNGELDLLQIEGAQNAKIPTAFGSASDVYFAGHIGAPVNEDVRFRAFDGIDKDFVPHAFVQAAIGLPAGTELTVRAMPEVTIDGVTASTYGIGLKHNLSQYFSYNKPEDFQLAAAVAYSKFDVSYAFEEIAVDNYLVMNLIDVDADLWMAEAVGSKRYGGFEVFGALGVANSKFHYTMGGSGDFLPTVNDELKTLGDTELQFKGDIGFNMYFGHFRVSTMATAGKFFNANLGLHYRL